MADLYRYETRENLLDIALARRTKRFALFYPRTIACILLFLLSMFSLLLNKNMNNEMHWFCYKRGVVVS